MEHRSILNLMKMKTQCTDQLDAAKCKWGNYGNKHLNQNIIEVSNQCVLILPREIRDDGPQSKQMKANNKNQSRNQCYKNNNNKKLNENQVDSSRKLIKLIKFCSELCEREKEKPKIENIRNEWCHLQQHKNINYLEIISAKKNFKNYELETTNHQLRLEET